MNVPIKQILLNKSIPATILGTGVGGVIGYNLIDSPEINSIHNGIENINKILPEDSSISNGDPRIVGAGIGSMLGAGLTLKGINKFKRR